MQSLAVRKPADPTDATAPQVAASAVNPWDCGPEYLIFPVARQGATEHDQPEQADPAGEIAKPLSRSKRCRRKRFSWLPSSPSWRPARPRKKPSTLNSRSRPSRSSPASTTDPSCLADRAGGWPGTLRERLFGSRLGLASGGGGFYRPARGRFALNRRGENSRSQSGLSPAWVSSLCLRRANQSLNRSNRSRSTTSTAASSVARAAPMSLAPSTCPACRPTNASSSPRPQRRPCLACPPMTVSSSPRPAPCPARPRAAEGATRTDLRFPTVTRIRPLRAPRQRARNLVQPGRTPGAARCQGGASC